MDTFFSVLGDLIKSGSFSEFQTTMIIFVVLFIFRRNILKSVFGDKSEVDSESDLKSNSILKKLDVIQSKIDSLNEKIISDETKMNRLENSINQVVLEVKTEIVDLKKDLIKWD